LQIFALSWLYKSSFDFADGSYYFNSTISSQKFDAVGGQRLKRDQQIREISLRRRERLDPKPQQVQHLTL